MNEDEVINNIAEEQMIRASALLSLLMPQASGVGIGIKGLDGRYQLANKAMETLFGKNSDQIVGFTDADLLPPEAAAQLQRSERRILDGGSAGSDNLEMAVNGMPTQCLGLKFPMLGPDGKILSIGVVMLDISQQAAVEEMRRSLERLQLVNQDLQKALVELNLLASSDKLTGAWNRRRLEEAVSNEMDRLKRYDHPLSLLLIDIDFFKSINDRHGHAAGDHVLKKLTAIIQSELRATDSLTRWGGEEFVVLCPNTTLSTAAMLAERLRGTIAKTAFPAAGNVTTSIGVAECISGETWDQWFQPEAEISEPGENHQPVSLGWHVSKTNSSLVFHEGGGLGYAALVRVYRDRGVASVLLVNEGMIPWVSRLMDELDEQALEMVKAL